MRLKGGGIVGLEKGEWDWREERGSASVTESARSPTKAELPAAQPDV